MLFLEEHARLVQIIHGVIGAALVAASTHLALWVWKLRRGQRGRLGGIRWLAAASCLLYALAFAAGNLLYPTYKVRVRLEYLDEPAAQRDEAALRQAAHERSQARLGQPSHASPAAAREGGLAGVARLFDIKEHWAAIGLFLAIGALLLARRPVTDGEPGPELSLLLACALGVAIVSWMAALIGLYVSSFRSLGAIG